MASRFLPTLVAPVTPVQCSKSSQTVYIRRLPGYYLKSLFAIQIVLSFRGCLWPLAFSVAGYHSAVSESAGMSLAAIHLTVNEPVHGTRPGKVNKDLSLTGDTFVTSVQ